MQSSARSVISAVGRGSGASDNDVDYHLAATDAEEEQIYNLHYRALSARRCRQRDTAKHRVTDRYDELPNAWTFGVYLRGQLCSSVRISVLTELEWRESTSADVFPTSCCRGSIAARSDESTRFVADPDQVKRVPELPYLTTPARLHGVQALQCRSRPRDIVRPEHQAFYRRVFLHTRRYAEPALDHPGLTKPFGLMAADFPDLPEEGVRALYDHALHRVRERRMLFGRGGQREIRSGRHWCRKAAHV